MMITGTDEMYLLYIKRLACQNGYVRNIDLSQHTNKSKSTVFDAVKRLEEKDLIYINNFNIILTPKGTQAVTKLETRHKTIVKLLTTMGVKEDMAEDNAGRIEHVVSDELISILKERLETN